MPNLPTKRCRCGPGMGRRAALSALLKPSPLAGNRVLAGHSRGQWAPPGLGGQCEGGYFIGRI
eukprot:14599709-Alexandrium_andersonii.AAC.1